LRNTNIKQNTIQKLPLDSIKRKAVGLSDGLGRKENNDLESLKNAICNSLRETFSQNGLTSDLAVIRILPSVPDSTFVFVVGKGKHRAALLVSPAEFPNVVLEEQAKACAMRNQLGPKLGSVILRPLAQGLVLERTYALLPLRRPLSNNRLAWVWQKRLIKSKLIGWLHDFEQNLISDSLSNIAHYRNALQCLTTVRDIDSSIVEVANDAIGRLLAGNLRPRLTPTHNDLWKGNILLPLKGGGRADTFYPFFLIDWRESRIDGIPFYDLIRLSMSLSLSPRELRRELIITCNSLGCGFMDVKFYIAAALGDIALQIDQFPLPSFLRLARACFTELEKLRF
jgi:hypothetical protein